ncbi:regulatory protein RecX [Moraxellaceae bacterium AER2_44_116]|nr:regulatory protein RecX [Moraxellaceae bacterium]TQC96149.1 regulatory protein RecX [Moraxellaceae bacterium AER2_44_116]
MNKSPAPTDPLSPTSLRSRALAMLARREHSQFELREKLTELGGESSVIDTILHEFSTENWQNDRRFTEVFIRYSARKGQGLLNIRQELKQRGITDKEMVEELLAEHDWFDLAQQTRLKKFGEELPTERKEQARQLRFLQYRGFSSEQCWTALKNSD